MKLSNHILALIAVFSVVSLIGCSNKQSPATTAQNCLASANQGPAGCPAIVASSLGLSQNQVALATAAGAPIVLPPASGTGTTLAAATPAPSVLPTTTVANVSDGQLKSAAAQVQKAMKEASANPNSSFYVDPSAPDIPVQSSNENASAAIKAALSRGPASEASSDGTTTQ